MDPKNIYLTRLEELNTLLISLKKKKSIFGILRFGTVAAIIGTFYFLWSLGMIYVLSTAFLLIVLFVWLIYNDLENKAAITHCGHLIDINKAEIKAMDGSFYHFKDGKEFLPKDHLYAADMDVFGHASLYQFLNRSTSGMGASQLAGFLLEPATAPVILARQAAVRELATKLLWRQELQAVGEEKNIQLSTLHKLQQWFAEPTLFLQFRHWAWLRILLPFICISVVSAALASLIPMSIMYFTLLIFAAFAYQINKMISPIHDRLSKIVSEIDVLSQSISLIEKETFQSALLIQLKQKYQSASGNASVIVRHLKKILDRLDLRYNIVVSAPLNLLLLWNLQQVLTLEQWKKKQAAHAGDWFLTLGTFEALNSFASIHYNNPDWCFPLLAEKYFFIEAAKLGHPLINKNKCVTNFININSSAELMLVTGSNMAGKSTYLRSVGVNVILSMAGAPVCAATFIISPVQLLSSMRVADNLEESTSTFYAELKKLKTIIDKVKDKEPVFILLDEILRGTNSLDRHTGSAALIRQLIKLQSAGIIATHDLALANLSEEYAGNILNYHFDAQVDHEELFFDYKLKPGVCESLNASILMKKIGIEL